jgi:hypothetical protein
VSVVFLEPLPITVYLYRKTPQNAQGIRTRAWRFVNARAGWRHSLCFFCSLFFVLVLIFGKGRRKTKTDVDHWPRRFKNSLTCFIIIIVIIVIVILILSLVLLICLSRFGPFFNKGSSKT